MRLIEFLQKYAVGSPLGESPAAPKRSASDAAAYRDLQQVQRTNELYFRVYFSLLLAMFVLTTAVALVYRHEMGGLAVVLGAGGAVQGGLVIRLSNEWREKVRVDVVSVLSRRLEGAQLQAILKELLQQLRK